MPAYELLYKLFADALPFGVCIVDTGGKVLYWNNTAEQITGYLSQEAVGRSCRHDLLAHCVPSGPCACDTPSCPLTSALHQNISIDSQLALRHKHGHRVPVRLRAIPLRDEHGNIVAVAELVQDSRFCSDHWWLASGGMARHEAETAGPHASLVQLRLCLSQHTPKLAVFLIGIEHQREMERARGTEMVLAAARALAHTIIQTLMFPHYFGAWTQRRFLLLVPNCEPAVFRDLLNTLEEVGNASSVVWWGDRIVPQVAVTARFAQEQESAEALLERLDPGWAASREPAGDV